MAGNWYQQFMPNLNGASIRDIIFTDSLNGYAVTSLRTAGDSAFILKTTNSGDNWNIKFIHNRAFVRIQFINANTGFTNAFTRIYKTTNAGENWNAINLPGIFGDDMFVLNSDTIWLAMSESLTGGVYFTGNGGTNWTPQFSGGNQNPNKIYMFNARIGFMSNNSASPNIYKTTNGGGSWTVNLSGENFYDMHFIDSLLGWKSSTASNLVDSSMKKTTNGGLSWTKQQLPTGPNLLQFGMSRFSCLNKDTIWGVGNNIFYPNSQVRGTILRTTNGGSNWLFQVPDTAIQIYNYYFINFVNKNKGWAYAVNSGIHTTNGGDPTWITGIQQISNEVPKQFRLFQNYPNPFNPKTTIKYQIANNKYQNKADVILKVFDVTGREITMLINQEQLSGTYQVDFSGAGYSSGVYFYSLIVDSKLIDTKRMVLVK